MSDAARSHRQRSQQGASKNAATCAREAMRTLLSRSWLTTALLAALACADPETRSGTLPTTRTPGSVITLDDDDDGARTEATSEPATPTATPEACARVDVTARREVPTVWLLIDGSGSMLLGLDGLGGRSRWTVLRDALMAESTGVVARLEGTVAFGMMIYDGGLSPPSLVQTPLCPGTVVVAPALNNLRALRSAYPELPLGGGTPTHYALNALSERIAAAGASDGAATYVVLATDGKPSVCDFHDGLPSTPDTEREAVEAVASLAASGIKSFAISLAGNDDALTAHLDAVARAGGTDEPALAPTTPEAVVEALDAILGKTARCDLSIDGTLADAQGCAGDVRLDGVALACDAPDGYRVSDDGRTLELRGKACETLRARPAAELHARFPCETPPVI